MRDPQTLFAIIHERGTRGLPLERVYRLLYNDALYLVACDTLRRQTRSLAPGCSLPIVAGPALKSRIATIIAALRQERYRWTPVRHACGEQRMLACCGPAWSDLLLQEALRLILHTYVAPQCSDHAHGLWEGRGCHTALRAICTWSGTTWFIQGTCMACPGHLDRTVLLTTLAAHIHDGRFLRLIHGLLQAGYLEQWTYDATYSGAPRGGMLNPLLAQIYMSRLDRYIEDELLPASTSAQPPVSYRGPGARASDAHDAPNRRLRYVRYAGDWLIGLAGPQAEAETIAGRIQTFLREDLKLERGGKRPVITHASSQAARFIGYQISTEQTSRTQGRRVVLRLPADVLTEHCQRYLIRGAPIHRADLLQKTASMILRRYQAEYRGLVQYYQLAWNLHQVHRLKWVMEQSLTRTLAHKFKISVAQVYDRYRATIVVEGKSYAGLQVTIPRPGTRPLVARWGGIPLRRNPQAILNDEVYRWHGR